MAERAIHRKSQLVLNSVIPVTNTHDELVREKLESCKFPFTITGGIKLLGIIISLTGLSLFLTKPTCSNAPQWYEYLYPITVGTNIICCFLLYLVFSVGLTVHNPGKWVHIDIFTNLILSLVALIASILTTYGCSVRSSLHLIPGPLGIAGAAILIASCAAIFLMYRFHQKWRSKLILENLCMCRGGILRILCKLHFNSTLMI